MNIRKIFNIPTKSQQALIDVDVQNITNKCEIIADIIINPSRNNRFEWKVDAIKVFDGCYAESITRLTKQYGRTHPQKNLTIRCLRKYYKSIYDGENKKYLEKI